MEYNNYEFDVQSVLLSGQYIAGVQSVNTEFDYPQTDAQSLGYISPVATAAEGNLNGEFSASRLMISSEDPVTGFFNEYIEGQLYYGADRSYSFETGILSNYQARIEVEEIPSLEFQMKTWGKISTTEVPKIDPPDYKDLHIPNPGDIEIIISDCGGGANFNVSSNAIESINLSIDAEWEAVSTLGEINPAGFYLSKPIDVILEITFQLNDFESPDFRNSLCSPVVKNVLINLNKCDTGCNEGELLRSFRISPAQLIDFNQYSNTDDVLMGQVTLKGLGYNIQSVKNIFKKI